jgi:hypothetical protein
LVVQSSQDREAVGGQRIGEPHAACAAEAEMGHQTGPQAEAWEASGRQVALVLLLLPIVIGFSWLIATVPI